MEKGKTTEALPGVSSTRLPVSAAEDQSRTDGAQMYCHLLKCHLVVVDKKVHII